MSNNIRIRKNKLKGTGILAAAALTAALIAGNNSADSGGVVFIFLARGRDIGGKPLNVVRPFFGQLRLQFEKLRISQKYILISAIAAGEGLSL